MNANYHFHIQNLHISQPQQHAMKDILVTLKQIQHDITLDEQNRQMLMDNIKTLETQLTTQKQQRPSVLQECLNTLRKSLESTISHAIITDIISKIILLLGGLK